jgi:KipI family sensor histidine kinase inhibitor
VERAIREFGESAILVEPFPEEDMHELSRVLRDLPQVHDAVPGDWIVVRTDAKDIESVLVMLRSVPSCGRTGQAGQAAQAASTVEIPVAFDGPDLAEVARRANMTEHQVVAAIANARLQVAHLGFAPGFAYVRGLPAGLSEIERRATPRTSVPAGSVAIAGGYLGVYPQASPGGWNLIGRTDMVMFDPGVPPYSTLQPGDYVRMVPADAVGVPPQLASRKDRPRSSSQRRLVVERPGTLTTLQDAGRRKVGHLGVPSAGPADPDLMRLANLVIGNSETDGLLEITIEGPLIRFDAPAHAVVIGAAVNLDGRRMEPGAVLEIPAGGRLGVGATNGLRGYVAVAGGVLGPELFGSCSSDQLVGLGIGPLQALDELALGQAGRPGGYTAGFERQSTVRVLPGLEPVDPMALREWLAGPFEVSPQSNRVGVRLNCARPLDLERAGASSDRGTSRSTSRPSLGMVPGAMQIPPSGEPIVLLCDHATMGGYPVVATVISADLGVMAQHRPGETVHFELVDLETARRARAALDRQLARAPTGHFPTSPV